MIFNKMNEPIMDIKKERGVELKKMNNYNDNRKESVKAVKYSGS